METQNKLLYYLFALVGRNKKCIGDCCSLQNLSLANWGRQIGWSRNHFHYLKEIDDFVIIVLVV